MFFISLLVFASKYILLIMNCTVGVWNIKRIQVIFLLAFAASVALMFTFDCMGFRRWSVDGGLLNFEANKIEMKDDSLSIL